LQYYMLYMYKFIITVLSKITNTIAKSNPINSQKNINKENVMGYIYTAVRILYRNLK